MFAIALFSISFSSSSFASSYLTIETKPGVEKISNLPLSKNLNCIGSGQIFGAHPGWSSLKSIHLTSVKVYNKAYKISWCPAAATSGYGKISYTVTAQLGGLTCQTTVTSCDLVGLNDGTHLRIMATDQSGSYEPLESAIQNSGIVDICRSGDLGCIAGTPQSSFKFYGSDKVETIPICTFAAIANWETVVLGFTPDTAQIDSEFSRAGGLSSGLTNMQTFAYWSKNGVGGVFLQTATKLFVDPVTLQREISDPKVKALIAQLHFKGGANFAGYQIANDTFHWVVIDGFTQTGPIAISWGHRLQMTWEQWNVEAIDMWRLTAR